MNTATDIGREELDRCCATHEPVVTGYTSVGGMQIAIIHYLAKRPDGRYLVVCADNLEADIHPRDLRELHDGDAFKLDGQLRRIRM